MIKNGHTSFKRHTQFDFFLKYSGWFNKLFDGSGFNLNTFVMQLCFSINGFFFELF